MIDAIGQSNTGQAAPDHAVDDERSRDRPSQAQRFTTFVADVEPRLRRALVGAVGTDRATDATAEALTYAWEHWERVQDMDNPAGYLYRVAQSAARIRVPTRIRYLVRPDNRAIPDVEPGLPDALSRLPERQRTVVWLVYACEWSYREVGTALDISASAVGTHARRGLAALRNSLGELHD